MVSIIIPYHNEGEDFIKETIGGIKKTCDVSPFEVIIVDDGSDTPLNLEREDDIHVVRHDRNYGVGRAFDTGVGLATYDTLILMGADIRFLDNGWAGKMAREAENHPKAITCGTCVGLNTKVYGAMNMEKRRLTNRRTGATILMFHDTKSNPKKPETFRSILDAKWLPLIEAEESVEIPCVLGACYSMKKEWYNYIDGWRGHRIWGTLEPMISLKSWLFGGSCRVAPQIETGHIFGRGGHYIRQEDILFNKMFCATTLIEDYQRFIVFLGDNGDVRKAKTELAKIFEEVLEIRKEYKDKKVMTVREYCDKFKIDYRL